MTFDMIWLTVLQVDCSHVESMQHHRQRHRRYDNVPAAAASWYPWHHGGVDVTDDVTEHVNNQQTTLFWYTSYTYLIRGTCTQRQVDWRHVSFLSISQQLQFTSSLKLNDLIAQSYEERNTDILP